MIKKIVTVALAAALLVSSVYTPVMAEPNVNDSIYGAAIDFDYDSEKSYQNFIIRYQNMQIPECSYNFKTDFPISTSSNGFKIVSYEGRDNVIMFPEGVEESAEFIVNVPQEGLYNLSVDVNLGDKSGNEMDLSLQVNGELQYNEASNNTIRRVWEDTSDIRKDSRDNDLRPSMAQKAVWQTHSLADPQGYTEEDLKVYLKAGDNTLKFTTEGQVLYLSSINIYNLPELKSYSEVKKEYDKAGYKNATQSIKFQAEQTYEKSGSTIYPVTDKSSPMTEPSSAKKIRLNTIGGTGWQSTDQWVTWKFNVEEAGLYNISLKYLQNTTSGKFTTRKIMVDGEIPFKELEQVRFPFSDSWQAMTLGDGNDEYAFYFDKGEHTLTMEVTFGVITDILREVNSAVFDMNEYYRKIVMISGTKPDTYRDYQFDKEIPGIEEGMIKIAEGLKVQKEALIELSGGKSGSAVTQLDSMIYDLNYMAKYPENISRRLSTYKNNIAGLSSWTLGMSNQPLQLDYITIKNPDEDFDVTKSSIGRSMKYAFDTFIASFTEDYDLISDDDSEGRRSVRVWVNLGRDQVGILKDLVTDDFTPKSDIHVKLELVQGALIEATLAGRGPDVALTVASDQPVNFAIRNALVDLSEFDDFDEVAQRFSPAAIVPFEFQGGYYAIPDTQNFEMMFYRKDILSDLGVGVPQTWEQFKQIVPIIRKNNMDIGWSQISTAVPNNAAAAFTVFNTLMYQKGGKYYSDDLRKTALGSDAAREAFKESTDYYINYEFPQTYDFNTRFRTGDMPLAIQAYTGANMLKVSAPEIRGLWDMAPIPGTLKEDGSLNRSQTSTVTACIMFKKAKDKDAAWEFMKWFTSDNIQAEYGLELEKVMGPSARYATSNREAFSRIPWTNAEQIKLNNQWDSVEGVPEVPGSYYTPRGIQNAFRTTIYDYTNAYETLHEWQLEIDKEIERKYDEFGLN